MKSPFIYLASPIDLANQYVTAAREEVRSVLSRVEGATVYDPAAAFLAQPADSVPGHHLSSLYHVNREALLAADLVVALFVENTSSVGVPAEASYAFHNPSKHLVLVVDGPDDGNAFNKSWMLAHWDQELRASGRGAMVPRLDLADWFRGADV